jgi:hypothetical protein
MTSPHSHGSCLSKILRFAIVFSCALAAVSGAQVTQQGRPATAVATHVSTRPTDSLWRRATPLGDFIQRDLHEGQPATERTEVRVISDGEALYIRARLYDSNPTGIVPGEKIRDGSIDNSDAFAVIIDTYRDHQNGLVFATTPSGIEYDGQVVKEGEGGAVQQTGQTRAQVAAAGGFDINWNGTWTVVTSIDSSGWTAEFRIPFSTFRYGGGGTQTWGINFERRIRRRNEDDFWAFIPREFNLYRLSRAGTIDIAGIPTARLRTVTPFVLGGSRRDFRFNAGARSVNEFGADAKLGVTPGLALDLTYNTDFAQVEVDDQRTNLTRFPLFYPEKRGFFLENAGFFSAGTPQAVELFFSRRIGIDSVGQPVPIRGGARLSGHAQGLSMGFLELATDGDSIQPANSYSVARISRELPHHSRVGLLGVQRIGIDTGRSTRNGTYAVDGRIGLSDAWTVDWWGAKTITEKLNGDEFGYSARAAYNTADWQYSARVISLGSAFNPEVAFVNRAGGYRYYEGSLFHFIRFPGVTWLKDWMPHASYRAYYAADGFLQESWLHVHPTEFNLASGGRFGPQFDFYREGLEKPFAIAPNVKLPAGTYDFFTTAFILETNASAPLSLAYRGDYLNFYNGTRTGNTVTITGRHGASVSSSLMVDFQDVYLDQGHFFRKLIGTRVAYFFTPRMFVQSLMQYGNQASVWTANARFGWLNAAGTGLYVVFNDGENADSFFSWNQPQSRSLVVKYTRQLGTGGQ